MFSSQHTHRTGSVIASNQTPLETSVPAFDKKKDSPKRLRLKEYGQSDIKVSSQGPGLVVNIKIFFRLRPRLSVWVIKMLNFKSITSTAVLKYFHFLL